MTHDERQRALLVMRDEMFAWGDPKGRSAASTLTRCVAIPKDEYAEARAIIKELADGCCEECQRANIKRARKWLEGRLFEPRRPWWRRLLKGGER